MKKIFFTLVVLLFAQLAFAQTTSFSDKNNTFTITHPSAWTTDDLSEDDRSGVELTAPKLNENEARGAAFMMIGIEKLPKGIKTFAQFIAMNDKQFKSIKEMKLLKKEKVGDKFAYTIQQSADGKVLKSVMYFWMAKGKIVSATYAAESKNYNINVAASKAIIESFTLN
jgi:hypothetical protein